MMENNEFDPLKDLKLKVMAELERYWQDQMLGAEREDEKKAVELQLNQVRFLPKRTYTQADDVVIPSALVEIETLLEGEETGPRTWCYVVPSGGGLILVVNGRPVQVVTPQSPMGEALLGKRRGEEVRLSAARGERRVRVRSLI
jgi:hypothetical protein